MQGQASEQQQLAFFATATATVEDIMNEGSGNSQQLVEQPGADAKLLAMACSQLDSVLSTDLQLFGSSPVLQSVYEQAQGSQAASDLMQKLQCTKPSNQQLSSALQDDKTLANSEPDFLQLEESMDTFLDAAQEFGQLFQQELEPWTSTMMPAALHGIGPMAVEVKHNYQLLQNLVAALSQTQQAHKQLSMTKAPDNPKAGGRNVQKLLIDTKARHTGLGLQQQVLPIVQQRLSTRTDKMPQLDDL